MVFICRPDVLLLSLSLLACATRVVQAGYINVGDTVALESAPGREASGLWIKSPGTDDKIDYTLTSTAKCDQCRFTLMSTPWGSGMPAKNQYEVGLRYKQVDYMDTYYMSCKSNGPFKGDKCRTRLCPPGLFGDVGTLNNYDCVSETFELFIHPGTDGLRLQDGDMVQLKNPKMGECVNNRDDLTVDMDKCNKDSMRVYWKIHKV